MASEHDVSAFVEPLPPKPSLELQQKKAKHLLRAALNGQPDAWLRIRTLHPKPPAPDALKLSDAQLVVARGYGFESWAMLRCKIDSLTKLRWSDFVVPSGQETPKQYATSSNVTPKCARR